MQLHESALKSKKCDKCIHISVYFIFTALSLSLFLTDGIALQNGIWIHLPTHLLKNFFPDSPSIQKGSASFESVSICN